MKKSNISLAFSLLGIVVGMTLLAYASVPLYRIFCQVTGYGGTTQASAQAPDKVYDRIITVAFNADIDKGLPWTFTPGQQQMKVKVGEQSLAYYDAHNLTDKPIRGRAVYNVIPHKAGSYFTKVECFCFEEQTLSADQKVHMPVSFYIDPSILDDPEMDDVSTITLSYTFFPLDK